MAYPEAHHQGKMQRLEIYPGPSPKSSIRAKHVCNGWLDLILQRCKRQVTAA